MSLLLRILASLGSRLVYYPMPCPRCQTVLQVTAADAGRQLTCGNCGQPILVPSAPGPTAPMMPPMPMAMPPPSGGGGSGWLVMGIVVLVLLVLCGGGGVAGWFFFGTAINTTRMAASRVQAQNNAKQIALCLFSHESQFNHFPKSATTDASGKPLLSWRVKILPWLEQKSLFDKFHHDESWDSPHNYSLISQMPQQYGSPPMQLNPGYTCWQAVVGPKSVIAKYSELAPNGSLLPGVSSSMIHDGLSNTITIVEVDPHRAVIWTKPDDFEYDLNDPIRGLGSIRQGAFLAAYADGAVRSIPSNTSPDVLRALFTRNGGEVVELP